MARQWGLTGKDALTTPSIGAIMAKLNSTERKQQDQTLLTAVQKNLAATASLVLDGTSYTPAAIEAVLQGDIDATVAAETAKAAWLVAAKAEDAQAPAALKMRRLVQAYAVNSYGDTDTVRSEWGMPPLKATVRTAASKAAAAAKAKATREAHKAALEGTSGTTPSASTSPTLVNGASATSAK
jgi:hypothetical protein